MTAFGQVALLAALVAAGFSAFSTFAGWRLEHRALRRAGAAGAAVSVLALTLVTAVLAWALGSKDFRFAYVAQYSSRDLPWHYSLSALWVGQAGSLLVWAWFLGLVVLFHGFLARREADPLREPAFALGMACLWFLVAVMVFGADPVQPSLGNPSEGAGLSPLLQHPAMLVHPPVVFLGYALWTVPFALAMAALVTGRLDAGWARQARPWALAAWAVLGSGILWGADWAYEELGWGGYWSWDPVENGSLIPWLTGTALIHTSLAWRSRGVWKKTALVLAVATFALCNFATFLTRSGIFSSLHAFSRSPIGWMFLAFMLGPLVGGALLVALRRAALVPDRPIVHLGSREVLVGVSTVALVLLAGVALLGTLTVPLSDIFLGRRVIVGPAFYNNVLIPIGLLLLATTAAAPLVAWGGPIARAEKRPLLLATGLGGLGTVAALAAGVRHPIALAVTWPAVAAIAAPVLALSLDARRRNQTRFWAGVFRALKGNRRQYAGYLIHAGFVCLALGVAGSSLGTRRHEAVLHEGETLSWAGRSIRLAGLAQHALCDKVVVEARLEVSQGDACCTLLPAQHLYRLQNEWTTEVAIHSTWTGDFYAILHGGEALAKASFTFVENPMMRWIWLGGWVAGFGALVGLLPPGRRAPERSVIAGPHWAAPATRTGKTASSGHHVSHP